jgi:hypothetical protein
MWCLEKTDAQMYELLWTSIIVSENGIVFVLKSCKRMCILLTTYSLYPVIVQSGQARSNARTNIIFILDHCYCYIELSARGLDKNIVSFFYVSLSRHYFFLKGEFNREVQICQRSANMHRYNANQQLISISAPTSSSILNVSHTMRTCSL